MDHQWFWQTEGQQYGPLSTEELGDLVRRDRVKEADEIRLDGSADWLPAAQVKAMFGAPVEPEARETGAQSAARVLAGLGRMRFEHEAAEVSWGARIAGLVGKGASGPATLLLICRDWIAAGLARLLGLFSRRATLGVIAVVFLAILFKDVEFGDSQAREAHADLAAAFEQMQAMKKREASKAEWQEFERETLEWLKPMLAELGELAVSSERGYDFAAMSRYKTINAHRSLVRAGWALAEAISDAGSSSQRGTVSAAERTIARRQEMPPLPLREIADPPEVTFAKRMEIAQGFMDGTIKEIKGSAPRKPLMGSIDPLIAGIAFVDVGVVGGAVVFWWKRRRRNESSR